MKKKLRLPAWIISLAMMFSIIPVSASASGIPVLFDESSNSIDDGSLSEQGEELYACFDNLIADEDYVVVISRSPSSPLESSQLIYITQTPAPSSGRLEVPFHCSDATEINYVAACRRDIALTDHSISVTFGTPSPRRAAPGAIVTITADYRSGYEFTGWSVLSGDVTLADPSQETTTFVMGDSDVQIEANYSGSGSGGGSSSGGSSGGGGGSGAAVVLGLGAAAAITAGVILTMPVDVQGHVELADHTAVPGAKISLLQKGNVVAQTTADESGNFSLKAKRGDYELIVVYTDANGQFVQKTTSIKAPAKDLVITF